MLMNESDALRAQIMTFEAANKALAQKLDKATEERDRTIAANATMNNQINDLHVEVARLREQADAKNDLRKALHDADLQNEAMRKVLFEILGTVQGSDPAPYLEIQALARAALDGVAVKPKPEGPSEVEALKLQLHECAEVLQASVQYLHSHAGRYADGYVRKLADRAAALHTAIQNGTAVTEKRKCVDAGPSDVDPMGRAMPVSHNPKLCPNCKQAEEERRNFGDGK